MADEKEMRERMARAQGWRSADEARARGAGSYGQGASPGSLLAQQILAEAAGAGGGSDNTMVPRFGTEIPALDYINEFYDNWEDPNFQTWIMSRGIASGATNGKSTPEDYLKLWEAIGDVAASGRWKGTPEGYLEWAASGRRMTPDEIKQSILNGDPIIDPTTNQPVVPGATEAVANPITTLRSTSSATVNREAAYAAADKLSQALLGRMATKAEMAKARRVMNGLLAANPTVHTATRDATDPDNIVTSEHTQQGMTAADAEDVVAMRMQRSSEGTAYTVGNMFEDAMRILGEKEG